jgi:hypothetical protein
MREYVPNPIIVKRTVELWKEMLRKPKYDNLGGTEIHVPSLLSSMLAEQAFKNNTEDVLNKFGEELEKLLLSPVTILGWDKKPWTRMINSLSVDYAPDQILQLAAERAGLKMQFPWKTDAYLYENQVVVSYGYAAPALHHYPLKDGRWFVSDISGVDVKKIITLIENGVLDLDLSVIK